MLTSHRNPSFSVTAAAVRRPLRLLGASLMLVLAAAVAQQVNAAPSGGMGGHGHHEGMMGGSGMGLGAPRHLERLLDSVNASAEQRAQIKQISQAARADLKARHQAGRDLREQAVALFVQPAVDARAVEALRLQMLAQHDQASQRVTQALLDVSRVLTPEQRKAMADRMGQRRAMMQRHRAEHDAAEAGAKR